MTEKVAVVTGSSSGIGLATSLLLARNGYYTYATMRNLDKSRAILDTATKQTLPMKTMRLDVNDDQSVKDAIDEIVSEQGRVDVLVNNAGYGLLGSIEDLSIDEIRAQFETNLFGLIRVTQRVLPQMRTQRRGVVVNISSVAGRIAIPGIAAYDATKFAVEGLSEAMRYELEPFGIKLIIIEPGAITTNFAKAAITGMKAADQNSPYAPLMARVNETFASLMEKGSSPDEVAKTVLEAVATENPQPRYLVGKDAHDFIEMRRKSSDTEFENFVKSILTTH